MTLLPEDVRKKTFTPVRLREGYDMGEVDQFLDEVEVELTRLHQENEDLRAKASGSPSATTATPDVSADGAKAAPAAQPVVRTIPEAANAAARLLEIAGQNAEQLVSEAHESADKIVSEATVRAERLEAESKAKAEALQTEAQTRSERLDEETSKRKTELLSGLERDRDSLASELESLRVFEREYRSRLRGYFESQLRALDSESLADSIPPPSSSEDDSARGLRGLLAGDADAAGGTEAEATS
jgi:DivIVA domain-containing protein